MQLRPYQSAAIARLRESIAAGNRRVLFVLPTGGGKTVCFSSLASSAVAKGKRVLIVVHREELAEQASDKLSRYGLDHGIHMGNHPRWRPHAPVQVASVQTLARRLDPSDRRRPNPDLIIVDEAHHARATSWESIINAFPAAPVLGFTATPWRMDNRGLGDLFEDVVVAATVRELTDAGALVPVDGFAFEQPDLDGVRKGGDDYNLQQLDEVMGRTILTGNIVTEWQAHATGQRTICFAVNIRHSRLIVEQFQAAGVRAEHVDGTTPRAERRAILERLQTGETTVVSSVAILTEGFDCPAASVAILARPTKSQALALQMMGRVLRPADGKTVARIHDHAGVLLEHGLPDDPRDYSLTGDKPASDGPAGKTCPTCYRFCHAAVKACPECEHRFDQDRDEGVRREIVHVDGKRISLDAIRARRAELGLTVDLPPEDLARAAAATRDEKAAEYVRLLEVADAKGFKRGWAAHQYRSTFAVWPQFPGLDLTTVKPAEKPFLPWRPKRVAA